uniref:Methyltransferase n=1 Tax=Ascaris lumbricoides TaxID=6252 RepID=A0A0M3HFW3_ASCLU
MSNDFDVLHSEQASLAYFSKVSADFYERQNLAKNRLHN